MMVGHVKTGDSGDVTQLPRVLYRSYRLPVRVPLLLPILQLQKHGPVRLSYGRLSAPLTLCTVYSEGVYSVRTEDFMGAC